MASEMTRIVMASVSSAVLAAGAVLLLSGSQHPATINTVEAPSMNGLEKRLERILESLQSIDDELRHPKEIPAAAPASAVVRERVIPSETPSPPGLDLQPLQNSVEELQQALGSLTGILKFHIDQINAGKEYQAIHDKVATLGGKKNTAALQSFTDWLFNDEDSARRSILFKSSTDILDMFGVPDEIEGVQYANAAGSIRWIYRIPSSQEDAWNIGISFNAGFVVGF